MSDEVADIKKVLGCQINVGRRGDGSAYVLASAKYHAARITGKKPEADEIADTAEFAARTAWRGAKLMSLQAGVDPDEWFALGDRLKRRDGRIGEVVLINRSDRDNPFLGIRWDGGPEFERHAEDDVLFALRDGTLTLP